MEEGNRIKNLKNKKEKYFLEQEKRKNKEKHFIQLGKDFAKTKEGIQFFLLAKEIYQKPNEKARDNSYNTDPLVLSRLNGEDYILRKIILTFIDNQEELDNDVK